MLNCFSSTPLLSLSLFSLSPPQLKVEKMRPSIQFGALLLCILLLISSSKLSARLLNTEQGQNLKLEKVTREEFVLELEDSESMNVVGKEGGCSDGDDGECFRRMALEAHLDYIYTQHHKP